MDLERTDGKRNGSYWRLSQARHNGKIFEIIYVLSKTVAAIS